MKVDWFFETQCIYIIYIYYIICIVKFSTELFADGISGTGWPLSSHDQIP